MQIISKAVGIDLGTTNSVVGLMNPGDTEVILHCDEHKRETTPSCVWRNPGADTDDKGIVVGHGAFARCGSTPAPVRSFKRVMGQDVLLDMGSGCRKRPEQLSELVLREMMRQINEDARKLSDAETRWVVNRAIVTVPAYFDQPAVAATKKAAEAAGLELLELLSEPAAAGIYHCWRTGARDGVFMVYDLGGGTFDVTILKAVAGSFTVLGLSGHTQLGGDNIDAAIAHGMLQRLKEEGYAMDLDMENDPEDRLRFELLKFLGEGIKKKLSDQTEYMLRDSSTLRDKNGRQIIFNTLYERNEVLKWMKPVIDRTIPYCLEALEMAQKKGDVDLADVDEIVFAGGSTHIPAVRERVRREFCRISPKELAEFRQAKEAEKQEAEREGRPPGNYAVIPAENRARCEQPVYEKVDTIVALGAAIRAAAVGGLHMTDDQELMRVEVHSATAPGQPVMQVNGHVKSLRGTPLTGCKICLYVPETSFDEAADLAADGHFFFKEVPVSAGGESLFNFEILDAQDNCLAVIARQVKPNDKRIDGGSTACLPKAISIDVLGDAGVERKVLIPETTSLPTKASFILRFVGNTDKVRFRLYQRRRRIKEVIVEVPAATPKGTQIDLTLHVDEFSLVTMKGKIGDRTFDAVVDPPPPRPLPTANDVAALEQRFQEALDYMDSGQKMPRVAHYKQTFKAYQDALKENDANHALHEFEELEDIVAGVARPKIVLQPPQTVFAKRLQEASELISEVQALLSQNNHDTNQVKDWIAKLEAYRLAGERAYEEGKQRKLADALQQINDLRIHVIAVVRRIPNAIGQPTPRERAQWMLQRCVTEIGYVQEGAAAVQDAEAMQDIRKLQRELEQASAIADQDPQAAVDRLTTVQNQIKQLAGQLHVAADFEDTQLPGVQR